MAEGFRLELGFNSSMALLPWEAVDSYTSQCWYKHLAEWIHYCNKLAAIIEFIEDITFMKIERNNDKFLMQEFIDAGIDRNDLKLINRIRMSIKAITISDISTADGKNISYNAWNGIESNGLQNQLDWPREPPLFTRTQLLKWQNALYLTFCVEHSNSNMRLLKDRYK